MRRLTIWRNESAGWAVCAAALLLYGPLFAAGPPWCDLTLYDEAVRAVRAGGAHYRDVFDTNPPGFVLALTAVRTLFGTSIAAAKLVDLAVVAAGTFALLSWARAAGAPRPAVAWAAAAAALFYPAATEMATVQRDAWMLLPVAAVAAGRAARIAAGRPDSAGLGRLLARGVCAGFLLGAACWVKPHALFPAAAAWLATAGPLAALHPRPRRARLADFAGNWLGGLLALGLGVVWLVRTGAWGSFVEVFTFWNGGYLAVVLGELPTRPGVQFAYFFPWSLVGIPALPAAYLALSGAADTGPRRALRALAVFYLVWSLQAFVIQRGFHYVHVPETLIGLALLAARGVPAGFWGLMIALARDAAALAGVPAPAELGRWGIVARGAASPPTVEVSRLREWPGCWGPAGSLRRRDALRREPHHFAATAWGELGEVADWFRARPPLRDGELVCWDEATHPLYAMLGVRPAFRFMHVGTPMGIGERQYARMRDELLAASTGPNPPRYAVADLGRMYNLPDREERARMAGPGSGGVRPPASFAADFPLLASRYPWRGRPLFRSGGGFGRYVVLEPGGLRPGEECRLTQVMGHDAEE